jgi:hypothetical protein
LIRPLATAAASIDPRFGCAPRPRASFVPGADVAAEPVPRPNLVGDVAAPVAAPDPLVSDNDGVPSATAPTVALTTPAPLETPTPDAVVAAVGLEPPPPPAEPEPEVTETAALAVAPDPVPAPEALTIAPAASEAGPIQTDAGPGPIGSAASDTGGGLSQDAEPEQAAPAAPRAPAVFIADESGVRVLQGPGDRPAVQAEIQIDAITYDTEGEVALSGRGAADASLRVILNNQPIQLGEIRPDGTWALELPDVDPGTYTLQIEEIASDGSVTSRFETPFLREDPERIRENPMLVALEDAERRSGWRTIQRSRPIFGRTTSPGSSSGS